MQAGGDLRRAGGGAQLLRLRGGQREQEGALRLHHLPRERQRGGDRLETDAHGAQFVDKVSKLRDDQIPAAITTFSRITDIPPQEVTEMRVTNSTWSGSLLPAEKVPVQLGSVMEVLSNYSDWLTTEGSELAHQVSISFRSQFFPGARLQHLRLKGTINLFNNGSFVIVGVEKACQVRKLLLWISAIMNAHWKNPLGGKSCAWIAE
jgi:hypothetical protein